MTISIILFQHLIVLEGAQTSQWLEIKCHQFECSMIYIVLFLKTVKKMRQGLDKESS